ncbi:hypothetical protein [Spiroplasma sp. SV19]|uniref:hypothetical protein n=1 Tax=Spiroplasma sp. SV19 TaxID=2570468 RepID=UPI0024B679E8|nr:hypothetical protein [Spiroplasma sp. SV19]WHQ36862.1 hypothetical protein E7Y35_03035 [Spiroplasma sp. SV19]
MENKTLQKILQQRKITTADDIIFRTIFDVLSTLFTDENHLSTLEKGYTINEQQQVWFPNIIPPDRLATEIKKGYANYIALDGQYLYQFDSTKDLAKRKKLGDQQTQNQTQFVAFAKFNEKALGVGYHFVGVFCFNGYTSPDCQTMIYKKIADIYHLPNNK